MGIFAAVFVLLLVVCAIAFKTVELAWVRQVLLPGDPEVPAAALENMVTNLRDGEGFIQVFKTFCEEIIRSVPLE